MHQTCYCFTLPPMPNSPQAPLKNSLRWTHNDTPMRLQEPKYLYDDRLIKDDDSAFFTRKPAGRWLEESKAKPRPKRLFDDFWCEGELCILFADTNVGKSILAVQICQSVASGEPIGDFKIESAPQKVLYFDFELSHRQFLRRYAIEEGDHYADTFPFHPNFERVEIDLQSYMPPDTHFEDYLFLNMQTEILESDARVVVIDNFTFLRTDNEKARDASPLMRRLNNFKKRFGISMLVLAHTPKRSKFNAITENDLQGSKSLMNLCDSSFTIGASTRNISTRYLKQIKERNKEMTYHGGHVPIAKLAKVHNFLRFDFEGFGKEREHLKERSEDDEQLFLSIKSLRANGKSYREIGEQLGISYKKVERILRDVEHDL